MYLIIGLGNPGKEYALNRHNAGQIAADDIIRSSSLTKIPSKLPATIFRGGDWYSKAKIIVVKPKAFMNECGAACAAVANFYKISSPNIIVLHDDLDMELGKVRVKIGSGDGGHNGIKSINEFIKNDYVRIKIGIGRPADKSAVNSHVLSNFTTYERGIIGITAHEISDWLYCIFEGELEKFSSKINDYVSRRKLEIKQNGI